MTRLRSSAATICTPRCAEYGTPLHEADRALDALTASLVTSRGTNGACVGWDPPEPELLREAGRDREERNARGSNASHRVHPQGRGESSSNKQHRITPSGNHGQTRNRNALRFLTPESNDQDSK